MSTASTSSNSVDMSASGLQSQFMNLLVAQLQNQNPMQPTDASQMTSELAQFSQLEQLQNLSSTFQEVLASQQLNEASGLIGRKVGYQDSQSGSDVTGTVTGVTVNNGTVAVQTDGGATVTLDQIQSVAS